MAEWNSDSGFNQEGHSSTFRHGPVGMRDDPQNQRLPIQETCYGNDAIEQDGFPSVIIPDERVHAQSVSGFSSYGMNIPQGGHLQQLLSIEQNQALIAHRWHLRETEYTKLKDECYKWNKTSGMIDNRSLMCAVCRSQMLMSNGLLRQTLNCPACQCLQITSNQEKSAEQQIDREKLHDVTFARHEHGEFMEERNHSTGHYPPISSPLDRNRPPRETSALDRPPRESSALERPPRKKSAFNYSELSETQTSEVSHNCFPRSVNERDPNHYCSSDTIPKSTINTDALYPDYQDEKKRYRTFNHWPSLSKMKPRELTKAGFFYEGTGDNCRCFHCGGLLRDWEDGDDPVEQHELWFPDCPYAQKAKATKKSEATRNKQRQIERTQNSTAYLSLADINDRRQDPDICGVCDLRKTEVTQLNCKHIVCRDCLPAPGPNGKRLCRICSEEVVKTIAFDSKCRSVPL